jgi:hypothetical protein
MKKVSAEVLVAIPMDKGSKKYVTYLGLLDTGCSSTLIDKDIINETFDINSSVPKTKWTTQAGTFETKGTVHVENYIFPQFTSKRKVTSKCHMFKKHKDDTYDIIISRGILLEIGITICYNRVKFIWDEIQVDMVPRGHWTRKTIDSFWEKRKLSKEEANAAIRKAEYKIADVTEIAEAQEHLSLSEKNKFQTMLQNLPLFQRTQGCFKGDPIKLELLPGSKPYFSKPYSILKAHMDVTKGEIDWLEMIGLLTRVQSAE